MMVRNAVVVMVSLCSGCDGVMMQWVRRCDDPLVAWWYGDAVVVHDGVIIPWLGGGLMMMHINLMMQWVRWCDDPVVVIV